MKLATLQSQDKAHRRDGKLIVVSRDGKKGLDASSIAPTLQAALDDWKNTEPQLQALYQKLQGGSSQGAFDVQVEQLHSPLPRAYQWLDGSAYINHIVLVRKARGAEPPETLKTDPLMYQGGSDAFIPPLADIEAISEEHGIDFEAEIAVIVDDTPMGVSREEAGNYIRLLMLVNDVSLRNLIPAELAKGFGFMVSKPSSAFGPLAVTPDELGAYWKNSRVHLPMKTWLNGERFGDPEAGPEMHFGFDELIAHAAKTRPLSAGTIIGSGTVSNEDRSRGSSCLAERRMIEKIDTGNITTPFMKFGDTVTIEVEADGESVFGRIHQKVVPYKRSR